MFEWKQQVIRINLGFEYLYSLELSELDTLLHLREAEFEADYGGHAGWNALPQSERSRLREQMRQEFALELGTQVFEDLPPDEQDELETFFYGRCSTHKELNAVKGGVAAFADFYEENSIEPPILLPNKDNDAAIRLGRSTGADTVVERALESSTRGRVKATALAGKLLIYVCSILTSLKELFSITKTLRKDSKICFASHFTLILAFIYPSLTRQTCTTSHIVPPLQS